MLLVSDENEDIINNENDTVSDKRLMVFSKEAVVTMAKASGEYRTVQQMQKIGEAQRNGQKKKHNTSGAGARPKAKVKGAWDKKRDQPKQRGYNDFKRYTSN